MPNSFITFEDFMRLPVFFWHTVGVDPYETLYDTASKRWLSTKFILIMINLNFIFAMELGYLYVSFRNGENFVEASMVAAYISFVSVGELKIVTVFRQKEKLTALVKEMSAMFPSPNVEEQRQYKVKEYLERCNMITRRLAYLFMLLALVYNLFMVLQFVIERYVFSKEDAKMAMPYTEMSPWNTDNKLGFAVMYMLQALAGYTCITGQLSNDILIYGIVMQDIMHFDYLSRTLKEFKMQTGVVENGYEKDLKQLQKLIAHHNKLLGISDVINEVFGVTLLLNFLSSSILVCFVGFQMTLNQSPEIICKLAVYLVAATVEIYLLCFFSDRLINASESIASAVYEMDWYEADPRFKKMLLIVTVGAQRPVFLKATVFLDISMATMTMFLQMSYRFFCVIRTMYH